MRFGPPLQRSGDIPGRFGPVSVNRSGRIEAVIIGLGVVRPVALGCPGLNWDTGARCNTAGAAGESDLEISVGVGLGRIHRHKSTGNITSADGRIITIKCLRLGAVFSIIVPHRDR